MCRFTFCFLALCLWLSPREWAASDPAPGSADLDAVRSAILKDDYDSAYERVQAYCRTVLELQRKAGPSGKPMRELQYTPSAVNNSYLLVMVEQVRQMQASGDLLSTVSYAHTLQRAIYEERLRRKPTPAQQLDAAEQGLLGASREQRYVRLAMVSQLAVDARAYEKARNYASELLLTADAIESGWPPRSRGRWVYYGHVVLARVALRDKDVKEARRHLAEAGKTFAATVTSAQGPDKFVITDFLDYGEKDAVIAYLKECAKSWALDRGQTAEWIRLIEKGDRPWFAKLKLK